MTMMMLQTDLPVEVLAATARALGFRVSYDRAPGVDVWTLSAGHGDKHVQYVGTKRDICMFLMGYGAMQRQTIQILNELDGAHRNLILGMRQRLDQD